MDIRNSESLQATINQLQLQLKGHTEPDNSLWIQDMKQQITALQASLSTLSANESVLLQQTQEKEAKLANEITEKEQCIQQKLQLESQIALLKTSNEELEQRGTAALKAIEEQKALTASAVEHEKENASKVIQKIMESLEKVEQEKQKWKELYTKTQDQLAKEIQKLDEDNATLRKELQRVESRDELKQGELNEYLKGLLHIEGSKDSKSLIDQMYSQLSETRKKYKEAKKFAKTLQSDIDALNWEKSELAREHSWVVRQLESMNEARNKTIDAFKEVEQNIKNLNPDTNPHEYQLLELRQASVPTLPL